MHILLASSSWRTNTSEKKHALSLREPAKRHLPFGLLAAERRLTVQGACSLAPLVKGGLSESEPKEAGVQVLPAPVLSGRCQGLMGPEKLWEGRSWSLAFKEDVARGAGPQVVQGQGDVHSLLPCRSGNGVGLQGNLG